MEFKHFFRTQTRECFGHACNYMSGLIQADKGNMEKMSEVVPNTNEQSLQHFISNSNWDYNKVLLEIASRANDLIGGKDTALLIDDSGFPKQGKMSAGVSRQYCGQKGKVDNCQVAVFATLAKENHHSIIDKRLYLPKVWTDDIKRCDKAGIPREISTKFIDKTEIAKELIFAARKRNINFGWAGFDGGYGNDQKLLKELDSAGEIFMADIACNTKVYTENPSIYTVEYTYKQECKKKFKSDVKPLRVDKLRKQLENEWKEITIRNGENGPLNVSVITTKVWLWDGIESSPHCWHLIIRKDVGNDKKTKYSLSNSCDKTSAERLAYMQSQRYWVERPFQDGKNEVQMGDYQVRSWDGWNKHIVMVVMVLLFMMEMKIMNSKVNPLLSCHDIKQILETVLPKSNVSEEEVIELVLKRHAKRESNIAIASKKFIANVNNSP